MTRFAALLLTLLVAGLLSWHSANYYFHQPLYEVGDNAANSLSVDRAKHFAELYGAYSRWGFHHPGPAFFYVQALGEWLFFDSSGVVPAPYNGQALICLLAEVGFFLAALHVFTQWLPARSRWWFFALALALAALHFGHSPRARAFNALSAAGAFQTTWSADLQVLVFLCLLAAGASVAAGRAADLPLLVLAGGCLVHLHVAQPMFVLPCTLLAYAGLAGACAARAGDPYGPPRPWWRRALQALALPWRNHRHAHAVAGGLLLLFVLPLAVDVTRGSHSNLADIVRCLRFNRGDHNPLLKSVFYFLQFGAYAPYGAGESDLGDFRTAGMWHYLAVHGRVYAVWLVAFGLAAWAIARLLGKWARGRPPEPAGRFLGWAGIYLGLSVALTLRWGVIQAGTMYYYNAFFNFAIYYFAALIAAAEAIRLATLAASRWRRVERGLPERGLAILAILLGLALFMQRQSIVDQDWAAHLATHDRVSKVIAADPNPGVVKFLSFPDSTWPLAVAVALQLERAGQKYAVSDQWRTMFGPEYPPEVSQQKIARTDYRKWTLVEQGGVPAGENARGKWTALEAGISLTTEQPPSVDPERGTAATIEFRVNAFSPALEFRGWSGPESWGSWVNGKVAILSFPVAPADGDVEMKLNIFPHLDLTHGLLAQRLRVSLNGERIGPEMRLALREQPPLELTVPAPVWNRARTNAATHALLELDLPDAVSPRELDPSQPAGGDARPLALGVRRISFQAVRPNLAGEPAPTAPPENLAADNSPPPAGYHFDGSPLPPAFCQGVSEDGWAGPQVRLVLPRTAGSTPFLRLEGVAVAAPGIKYPYTVTIQADAGLRADTLVPAPGQFDILAPLTQLGVVGDIRVQISFPQTFALAPMEGNVRDRRELSVLLQSLRITSADQPVLACFRQGWYDEERGPQDWWRWSNVDSAIEVAAERSGTLVVTGDAEPQILGNALDVQLDGAPFATLPLPNLHWSPIQLRVPITAGEHVLTFHSHLPGVRPPDDPRVLAFGLRNAVFKLER